MKKAALWELTDDRGVAEEEDRCTWVGGWVGGWMGLWSCRSLVLLLTHPVSSTAHSNRLFFLYPPTHPPIHLLEQGGGGWV